MPLRLLTCLLTAVLTAPALAAQGLELPPPPKPQETPAPEAGGQQNEGEEQATTEMEGASDPLKERPALWADSQTPAEQIFLDFEMARRGTEAASRNALNDLRNLGLGTHETALKALTSPYAPSVVLAAQLLEWVGDPADADALVAAASSTPDTAAVNACLSCAMRLGNGKLPATAVKLLDHPRRQVRTLAEARLSERPAEEYLPKLLQFLNYGRDKDLKLRAARLLALYPDQPEVKTGLRATLAGDSVEVAMVAVRALQGSGSADDVAWLEKELLVAKTTLEAGYLAFGLVELQDQRPELILNPGLESRLRFLLDDQDIFVSGAAAATLAELAFRADLVGSQAELDRKLPLFLVRAVGGVIFYPQYATFAPLAERSLRRITGEDFGTEDRQAWIRWLQENQDGFHLVRGQIELDEDSRMRMRLAWSDGPGLPQAFVGPEAAWNYGDRVLGPADLARLQAALERSLLLDASVMPGTYGLPEAAVSASFDLNLGTQRKMVRYRGTAGENTWRPLLAVLHELEERSAWQSLATRDEAGRAFVLEHLASFDGMDAGPDRQRALLGLMRLRLDSLDGEALRNWVDELREMPDLVGIWSEDLANDFLRLAAREAPADPLFAEQLLDLALTSPSAGLLNGTIEALMALDAERQAPLLAAALRRFAPQDLAMLLGDPRVDLRVAAVGALVEGDPATANPLLRSALDDPEEAVVRRALRGLGTLAIAEEANLQALMGYASVGVPVALRGEALWGLGRLGQPEAVPLLLEAAGDSEMAVQVAAIDALGRLGGRESEDALSSLFPDFAEGPLESSYLRAVMGDGAARARRLLRPHLLSEDPLIANRAALLAGGLADPAAAPALMDMLATAPRDAELLEALAVTFATDFRRLPDPAGTYQAWWRDNMAKPPAAWLRKAANDAGYPLAEGFTDPSEVPARESGRVLLDLVLRGPSWTRPAAAFYLQALSGIDAPVILARTPPAEVERRAADWSAWLLR